jgi:hypothetical protein
MLSFPVAIVEYSAARAYLCDDGQIDIDVDPTVSDHIRRWRARRRKAGAHESAEGAALVS